MLSTILANFRVNLKQPIKSYIIYCESSLAYSVPWNTERLKVSWWIAIRHTGVMFKFKPVNAGKSQLAALPIIQLLWCHASVIFVNYIRNMQWERILIHILLSGWLNFLPLFISNFWLVFIHKSSEVNKIETKPL